MGCRQTKQQVTELPLFNMLVVGLTGSGKTSLISKLKGQSNVSASGQLDITTFVINKQMKIMAFQVSGKAIKTWKNYYPTANIVLFVIDCEQVEQKQKIKQILDQIDNNIKQNSKIMIVFNKIDKINEDRLSIQDNKQNSPNKNISSSIQFKKKITPFLNKLQLQNLQHETCTTKCSALTGQGILPLIKKLHTFILPTSINEDVN